MEEGREKPPMIPTPSTPRGDGGHDEKRPPAPPKTQRRAREVSSRYMAAITSPVTSSSSISTPKLPPQPPKMLLPKQKHHHALFFTPSAAARRSTSPPMRRAESDAEGSCYGDENNFQPTQGNSKSDILVISEFQRGKDAENQRAVRLFRENGSEQLQNPKIPDGSLTSRAIGSRFFSIKKSRPGTPIVHEKNAAISATPRSALDGPNRARSAGRRTTSRRGSTQVNCSLQESPKGAGQLYPGTLDYDANSCRSSGTSPENSDTENRSGNSLRELGFCDSPTIHGQSSRSRISSECRSSMPASDSSSHRGISSSLCNRSLNSAFFNCHPRQSHPQSSVCKSLKDNSISARAETKGKKNSDRQEESHHLRILQNRYLQWRFINAKAQTVAQSRTISAERSLHSLSAHLLGLRDSVATKRIELNQMKNLLNASEVLEAQMPLLSEWASLEDEHSNCLSSAVKSLQDASLRLPVSANLKADVREISEALSSATDVLESLASRVGSVLSKVDGMKNVASDLAEIVCEERARIEECGDLLAEAHALQVKDCSLRTHLIQQR